MPSEMNDRQRRAVSFKDGTMLLLAGPGSGKTFVITHRISELIKSGADPGRILVITFTKAAAVQMKERFEVLMENTDPPPVCFGTFHAIFFNILKSHRSYSRVIPITDKEKYQIIRRAAEASGLTDRINDSESLNLSLSLISSCKNNGNSPESFDQESYAPEEFKALFCAYNELLKDFNRIDFDDMVNLCLEVLKNNSEMRRKWQERFEYILIDEFQDISENQYELVKLLAFPQNNIFAVGDDDQSIYRFRGARVELMHRLLNEIPGAKKDMLDINYRSSGHIVECALKVVSENRNRFSKKISASREMGEKPVVTACNGLLPEKEMIFEKIKAFTTSSDMNGKTSDECAVSPGDIAILFRTNRQAAEYALFLQKNGIEVNFKNDRLPFSSQYIKDICAYFSLAEGSRDRADFLRIINRPVRFIKRAALENEKVSEKMLLCYYSGDRKMQFTIKTLFDQLERLKFMRPFLAIHFIRNTMGYDRYVRETVSASDFSMYRDEMEEFTEFIKPLRSYAEVREHLEVALEKAREQMENYNSDGVKLMTFHGSKGLEFKYVFLPDINEGTVPPKNAQSVQAIEEERRMFYVAMTRAKDGLYMYYRNDSGRKPSRFLKKLM